MKDSKNKNFGICVWLAIISLLLFCGVVLFAAYVYRFDPLLSFMELFNADANVFWSTANALATIGIGVATIFIILLILSRNP